METFKFDLRIWKKRATHCLGVGKYLDYLSLVAQLWIINKRTHGRTHARTNTFNTSTHKQLAHTVTAILSRQQAGLTIIKCWKFTLKTGKSELIAFANADICF